MTVDARVGADERGVDPFAPLRRALLAGAGFAAPPMPARVVFGAGALDRLLELVEEPGAIGATLGRTGVAVLAPSRWLRAADVLPHDWAATSDSAAT